MVGPVAGLNAANNQAALAGRTILDKLAIAHVNAHMVDDAVINADRVEEDKIALLQVVPANGLSSRLLRASFPTSA